MEFELNIRKEEEAYWWTALVLVILAVVVFLGWIGSGVTTVDQSGNPRVLSWSAWKFIEAEHEHAKELSIMQADASQLALALEAQHPDPVATQFLVGTIGQHAKFATDPSLANAWQALENASLDVRDWASGALDRNTAIQSLQQAMALLK